ncbi:MAG: hypothetical protein COB59_03030 [Rhodospirillaceae bacterium]|nr:MAG: hypothetical protein COB59_03030 [Rhodospirillaceae bacterium]
MNINHNTDANLDSDSAPSRDDQADPAKTKTTLDRECLQHYGKAIEAAVQQDQFEECALLFSELISVLKEFAHDQGGVKKMRENLLSLRALHQAQILLNRCRELHKSVNVQACNKLRDDIRNGLVLLLSDALESEQLDAENRRNA